MVILNHLFQLLDVLLVLALHLLVSHVSGKPLVHFDLVLDACCGVETFLAWVRVVKDNVQAIKCGAVTAFWKLLRSLNICLKRFSDVLLFCRRLKVLERVTKILRLTKELHSIFNACEGSLHVVVLDLLDRRIVMIKSVDHIFARLFKLRNQLLVKLGA